MIQLPLEYQSGTTFLADLNPEYYITNKKHVIAKLTANNAWSKPIQRIAPIDFIELSETKFKELNEPYDQLQEYLKTDVAKHLQGQHDQSTHAGKKSYKSIDDIVKDGLDIQQAIDELGGSNVENGNVAMRVLLERMGKGGKPEIVASISDLDGDPIYRGTPDENAENFINGNYDRIGLGHNGDGYYFSNKGETALQYAGRESVITAGWKQDAKVMKFTNPDTALIDYKIASSEAGNKWLSKLNMTSGQPSAAQEAIFDNFAKYSADAYVSDLILQGYDGVEYGQPFDGEAFTIVFNREALQVVSN